MQTQIGTEREIIEQHLLRHAGNYNPAYNGDTQVTLVRSSQRACARLYWFRIGDGNASQIIIAKVPGATADAPAAAQSARPCLAEPPQFAQKYAREHRALDLLHRNFSGGNERRFGAVPLLDRIDLHIEAPALSIVELRSEKAGESSEKIRERVNVARGHLVCSLAMVRRAASCALVSLGLSACSRAHPRPLEPPAPGTLPLPHEGSEDR